MINEPCLICGGKAWRNGMKKGRQQFYCAECGYNFLEGSQPRRSTLLKRKINPSRGENPILDAQNP